MRKNPGIILVVLLQINTCFAGDTLSYKDLVQRIYDLEYLSTIPSSEEKSGNFSSYDRRSKYDASTQTYVQWGANGDGTGFIRKEGNGMVVFEKEGPGVIWRLWSALAKEGHIKIYIDHAEEPVVDKPFRNFFEEFGDDIPPMNYPNMVMTLSRGRNHFLPIPYNKHCKIVLSENWGAYYHITYTTFPKSTKLPIYPNDILSKDACFAIAEADRFLGNRGYCRKKYENEIVDQVDFKIEPEQTLQVAEIYGKKAITSLKFRIDGLTGSLSSSEILKDLWLKITWDNENYLSVLAPLGMFFGSGNKPHPYRSLPLGVIGDELYSNWFMPFSYKAKLELINKGDKSHDVVCEIVSVPIQSAGELLRFHALWHDGSPFHRKPSTVNTKDILIEDFEDNNYKGWSITGHAFGNKPVKGEVPGQHAINGYEGQFLINTYQFTDTATGIMRSKTFTLKRKYLNLLIGGGAHANLTCVNLLIDGKVVRTATGSDSEELYWVSWDLNEFAGKKARIEIVDNETGGWGHINVDQIFLSDANKTRTDGRGLDWPVVKITGKGRFCGLTLHVENTWDEPEKQAEEWWYGKWGNKTIDWWWGEGDEKFFVDGEKFPSNFGTGSEDYIGYAWSAEPPFPKFDSPFACQPYTPINGNGHTIVNRFQIADNVPFQKSFEAYLEKYKKDQWGKNNRCLYDVVVYWYQLP